MVYQRFRRVQRHQQSRNMKVGVTDGQTNGLTGVGARDACKMRKGI